MEQKENADNKDAVKGSVFGKNNSLSNTAMWTYNMRSKYSRNVPMDNKPTASFCSLVRLFCSDTFIKSNGYFINILQLKQLFRILFNCLK